MPGRVADFGQSAVARQRVADERVAAVVNLQRIEARQSQYPADGLDLVVEGAASWLVRQPSKSRFRPAYSHASPPTACSVAILKA